MKKILENVIGARRAEARALARGELDSTETIVFSLGKRTLPFNASRRNSAWQSRKNGLPRRLRLLAVTSILFIGLSANAYVTHEHNEYSYQKAWAQKYNAILEYKLDDKTRVDCLTPTHAIEFDFANKWAESVGQALYYALKTGKKPMVILILEKPPKEMLYFNRVKRLANAYNFEVQYVTKDILNLDKNNKCSNPKCKCHKK